MLAIIFAIAHFFYSTCPSFEKVGENFKKTFLSSSSDEKKDKKESFAREVYETAKNAGGIVIEGLEASGKSLLDCYLISGKFKDEKGEFSPPNWCDELKKFHKKSDSILETESDSNNKNAETELNSKEVSESDDSNENLEN